MQLDVPAMSSLSLRLSPVGFDARRLHRELYRHADATASTIPSTCGRRTSPRAVLPGRSTASAPTSGTFTLTSRDGSRTAQSCEGALFQTGAFTCDDRLTCDGAVGARTCRPRCTDGIDNNGDGKIDFPNDPGCADARPTTARPPCARARLCPACADGTDNDGDGADRLPGRHRVPVAAAGAQRGLRTEQRSDRRRSRAPARRARTIGATDDSRPELRQPRRPRHDRSRSTIPTTLQSLTLDTDRLLVDTVLSFTTRRAPSRASSATTTRARSRRPMINVSSSGRALHRRVDGSTPATLGTFTLNVPA